MLVLIIVLQLLGHDLNTFIISRFFLTSAAVSTTYIEVGIFLFTVKNYASVDLISYIFVAGNLFHI